MNGMRKVIQESIETWKSSSREIKQLGEYRPLKYYIKLGYSKKRIRRHCNDKKYNPLTGWTYRIFVDSLADITKEGSTRSDKTLGESGGAAAAVGGGRGMSAEDAKEKLKENDFPSEASTHP